MIIIFLFIRFKSFIVVNISIVPLIEIISEETAGQRLPLFLDDIFMQYDAPRRKSGVAFLKEYAKEGQVILCTPRPVE